MVVQIPPASGAYMERVKLLHLRACEACNLSCAYCVMSAHCGQVEADAMTATTALQILELFLEHASAQKLSVEISGGEPLLCGNGWLAAVCSGLRVMESKYAKQLSVRMTTNGTLLNEEAVAILRDCRVGLCVGVDAPEGASSGVKTLSRRVRKGIELLQESYMTPAINAVATLPAIKHIERFMDELVRMDIREFRLTPINNRGRVGTAPEQLPSAEEAVACTMLLIRHMQRCGFAIVEKTTLDRVYRYMGDVYEPNFCHSPTCPAGSGFLAVDAKGDIYPCGNETRTHFLLGNIFNGFERTRSRRVLVDYHEPPPEFIRCISCRAGRICHYGCPGCTHEGDTEFFEADCRMTQMLFEQFEINDAEIKSFYHETKGIAPH